MKETSHLPWKRETSPSWKCLLCACLVTCSVKRIILLKKSTFRISIFFMRMYGCFFIRYSSKNSEKFAYGPLVSDKLFLLLSKIPKFLFLERKQCLLSHETDCFRHKFSNGELLSSWKNGNSLNHILPINSTLVNVCGGRHYETRKNSDLEKSLVNWPILRDSSASLF